ncbi:MAG: hypothetical protein H7X80_04645, partial [bacterium]|nr:hypothetical protein [Candidatus Kapabacteria bacterium]
SWNPISVDASDTNFVAVIADRYGSVFAATRNRVYVSRDDGATWVPAYHSLSGFVRNLALDSSGVLYVATYGAGVLRSQSPASRVSREHVTRSSTWRNRIVVRDGDPTVVIDALPRELIRLDVVTLDGTSVYSVSAEYAEPVIISTQHMANGVYGIRVAHAGRVQSATMLLLR